MRRRKEKVRVAGRDTSDGSLIKGGGCEGDGDGGVGGSREKK